MLIDKTAQIDKEELDIAKVDKEEPNIAKVDKTPQIEVDKTPQIVKEELGVAKAEAITILFESNIRIVPTQPIVGLYSMFNTTIEPQTLVPLRVPTNSSLFYLYTPTNLLPLRIQSVLLLLVEFDYSEFPS